jgi:hypothetical protein
MTPQRLFALAQDGAHREDTKHQEHSDAQA